MKDITIKVTTHINWEISLIEIGAIKINLLEKSFFDK